ncbi:MAG: GspE/PulE family protein [Filifactoraceae bacterium]
MNKYLEVKDAMIVQAMDEVAARTFCSIAFSYSDDKLHIAIPINMPQNVRLELENFLSKDSLYFQLYEYPKGDIEKAINTYYSIMLRDDETQSKISKLSGEDKIDELWTFILSKGLELNASDIHIEFMDRYLIIKFRIAGSLKSFCLLKEEVGESLVRIIKLHSKLDISRVFGRKEGRMFYNYKDYTIDLRITVVRTLEREKVHIRLLNSKNVPRKLFELEIEKEAYENIKSSLNLLSGFILVCGPTGSGKSTTLRCIMSELDNGEKHIVSLEDPIEYTVPNITQIQINEEQGFGFNDGLKSLLRIDPDIIYIGELRDKKSAEMATSAAITGHLVLSTLHTKSALSAIDRLRDLGINQYSIASSLSLIINQRLVRILCKHCKERDPWNEKYYIRIGCDKCNYTGIYKRKPLLEVIKVDNIVKRHILEMDISNVNIPYLSIADQVRYLMESGSITYEEGVSLLYE